MKITYLGHATLKIEVNNTTIIVDPFITENPKTTHLEVLAIKADYVLVTHAHQDHILDVETIAKNNNATVISSFEIANYFEAKECKVIHLNVGGKLKIEDILIYGVAAVHSSSFPDGSYGGLAQGYVIENNDKRIYIAGDTALTYDMKLISETIGSLDLAILPIGDTYTMGFEEALLASNFVECNKVLGYHFDTFPPLEIDKALAHKTFSDQGKELILLEIEESINL